MSTSPVAKKIKQTMAKIGTHSGTFHADESLAVYMLRLLPQFKGAEVFRSRDYDLLEECDIIVDVTGKYDGVKHFDHHQREFDQVFGGEYQTKLSSAGLVYKHFGKEILASVLETEPTEEVVEELYTKIYEDFVEAIDANDNGISVYESSALKTAGLTPKYKDNNITLPSIVSRLNPLPAEAKAHGDAIFDSQFNLASELMGNAFVGLVVNLARGWFPAKKQVSEAYLSQTRQDLDPNGGRVLLFESQVFWKSHLDALESNPESAKGEKILYVVYPGGPTDWRIQAVGESPSSFVSRKALPEPWRGIRDDALSELTGVPECTFIHASGFIGGNKTKEGALELAKKALTF